MPLHEIYVYTCACTQQRGNITILKNKLIYKKIRTSSELTVWKAFGTGQA